MSETSQGSAHKRGLLRGEAAEYVSEHWFPCSPKHLAKLAVVGGGPPFRKASRLPLYNVDDLDGWAAAKIGPRVHSTSELREVA